jgi:two-component system sensor histidine kinase KdpD
MVPSGVRIVVGVATAMAGVGLLSSAMVPLRDHLSVATTALVLVVPVVSGVAIGGLPAGVVGVASGFLAYDFFFIPPYGTLSVGVLQNWVALGVYVVVMLVVSWVVAGLQGARTVARDREQEARRLFEVSDLLIGHKPSDELLQVVAATVREAFGLRTVALLLPTAWPSCCQLRAAASRPWPATASPCRWRARPG